MRLPCHARQCEWCGGLFQHPPEAGSIAAGGGHHIAAAEQRSIAVTHNELQFRQIPEMRGVVVK